MIIQLLEGGHYEIKFHLFNIEVLCGVIFPVPVLLNLVLIFLTLILVALLLALLLVPQCLIQGLQGGVGEEEIACWPYLPWLTVQSIGGGAVEVAW